MFDNFKNNKPGRHKKRTDAEEFKNSEVFLSKRIQRFQIFNLTQDFLKIYYHKLYV